MTGAGSTAARSATLWRDRALWSRAFAIARPHRRGFVLVASLMLAGNLVLLSYPLIYGKLVGDLVDGRPPEPVAGVIVGVLALTALHFALRLATAHRSSRLYGAIGTRIQGALFDRIQRQPVGFFTVSDTGAIASRTVDEAAAATAVYRDGLHLVFNNVVPVALTTVALAVLDWRALGAVALVALALVPARRFERRFRQASVEEFFAAAELRSRAVERLTVDGNLLVKSYGRASEECEAFREEARATWEIQRRLEIARATVQGLVLLAVNAVALLLLVAAAAATGDPVSVGTIVAVLVYLRLLEGPLGGLADARLSIARDLIALARVLEVLDGLPAPAPPAPASPPSRRGRLELRGVAYTYPTRGELRLVPSLTSAPSAVPENPPSLHDVTFVVEPGELVALVGRSGAGKSTIALLAAGLLTPTAGRVTIDGSPAARVMAREGQREVALVTQETFLFHDTLRNNVRYARPDATEEELLAACVAASVHDFAWSLPLRYQTMVGVKGQRLSGGERQRIALARAILRDPALVVLDEPTAHLDTVTEAAVQRALDEVFAERARLVIAHRLSTIRRADRILVLDDGRIAEAGDHAELLAAGGRYQTLYGVQLVDAGAPGGEGV